MATLADELLNDFEDSESEGEGEKDSGFLRDDDENDGPSAKYEANGVGMDVDEPADGKHEDEEMEDEKALADFKETDTAEEAKSKVERMQLGSIGDVRSVAGLMKTLEPVLEVCSPRSPLFTPCPPSVMVYISARP